MNEDNDPTAVNDVLKSAERYALWRQRYDEAALGSREIDRAQEECITLAAEVRRLRAHSTEAKPVNSGERVWHPNSATAALLDYIDEHYEPTLYPGCGDLVRLAQAVRAAQPTEQKPVDGGGAIGGIERPGGFVDGALERAAKLLADNPGIDLGWGLEADAVHLATEVRRLREQWDATARQREKADEAFATMSRDFEAQLARIAELENASWRCAVVLDTLEVKLTRCNSVLEKCRTTRMGPGDVIAELEAALK